MVALCVPFPSGRLGFNQSLQEIKNGHMRQKVFDKTTPFWGSGFKNSFGEGLSYSLLSCAVAKGLFTFFWTHLNIAWTNLAIVAGTLFILTFLTTPISSCYSPILHKISNLTNTLAFLAVITIHSFHAYQAPSPLNIASLLLMIAIPLLDSCADRFSAKKMQERPQQEKEFLYYSLWGPDEPSKQTTDEPSKQTTDEASKKTEDSTEAPESLWDECKLEFYRSWKEFSEEEKKLFKVQRILFSVSKAKIITRIITTVAWSTLYALAPTPATPLQQAFLSVLCIRNIFRTINSPAEGL